MLGDFDNVPPTSRMRVQLLAWSVLLMLHPVSEPLSKKLCDDWPFATVVGHVGGAAELELETEELVDEPTGPTLDIEELLVIDCADEEDEGIGVDVLIETITEDDELNAEDENSDEPQTLTSQETVCCTHDTPDSEVAKLGIGIVGQMDADMAKVAAKQCIEFETRN